MRFALILTAFFLSAQGLPIAQDTGMVESPPLVPKHASPSMPESGQVKALPVSESESGSVSEAAPETSAHEEESSDEASVS